MEKQAPVFVVVPSYNHAPFVERCLRSIIAQSLRPKKLLVIDDGSSDGSPQIIEKVLSECPFDCDMIARENRGLAATLNQAFSLSSGDFFSYLGSDDVWLPTFLSEQTTLLNSRPRAVLAFAHAYVIDELDQIVDTTKNWADFADGNLRPALLRGAVFSSPGVIYRRSALEKYRWNEGAKLEDYEMYLRLSCDGEFARNEKILCAWRVHGVNESTNLPNMFPEMIAAQDRLISELGVSRSELDQIQRRMKFNAVDNFIRHGFRREAARMFVENIRGARSFGQIAGTALRLAIPHRLFQWNRRRKRTGAALRYGTLEEAAKKKRMTNDAQLTIIKPGGAIAALDLGEIWKYRELLYFLTLRDIKIRYKQTLIGIAWVVLQPVLTTAIFTVIFSTFARFDTGTVPYPLFALSGLGLWLFVHTSISLASISFVNNTSLITKVYFPRLIVPLASALATLFDLLFSLLILAGLMLYFGVAPTWQILSAPVFVLLTLVLAVAFGTLFSALNVRFRDVKFALPFMLQVWLIASPVFYPANLLSEKWKLVFAINPLTGILEGFRSALFGTSFDWQVIGVSVASLVLLSVASLFIFKKMEDKFADLI